MHSLVQLARALADETRLRILTILLGGDATVSDLVTRLGIPQPRVSTHLALLRKAGLVSIDIAGRQRVYRPSGEGVRTVLEALQALAPTAPCRSPQATREVRRNTAMRQARTCYDHLAGVAGVLLLDEMLRRGWIARATDKEDTRSYYCLTPQGVQALEERGVDVARARKARRCFAYGCLDWTERRAHLGGALAAAILRTMNADGFVRRQRHTRAVVLCKPVTDWLEAPCRSPAAE
jgi:DNA-binding transcriptional ArsR family regulator